MRRLACAQSHLRGLAFGNSHKGNQESRKLGKDKWGEVKLLQKLQCYKGEVK